MNRHERYLHELPPDWPVRSIAAVGQVLGGSTPSRDVPTYWGGDIPWATPTDMTSLQGKVLSSTKESITEAGLNNSGARLLPTGSVVVTTRASIGMAGVAGRPLATNQGFKSIIPNREIDPSYLFHLLGGLTHELYRRASGTTFQEISGSEFGAIRIPCPQEGQQARIAEVLDTLDEAIRGTRDQIRKKAMVYEGLQVGLLGPRALQSCTGWAETRLEDISDSITSGPRGWASYYAEEGDFFLRIGNLTRKHLDLRFDDVVKVQPPTGAEGVRTALAPGDLLISITADLGIIGVVPAWMGVAYINQHIARVRLNQARVNPRFLGYQLSGQLGQKQFYRLNDVGAKAGLNLPTVGRLRVWLPPLPEQNQIAATLDGVQKALQEDKALLSKLVSLKSGLSSDLLTGRVRVPMGVHA